MNGFRALVFQDLPHVLPPKGLQLSSSRLHTTSSTRRFWSFFEFSAKEEICRGSRKCGTPKDIVSSALTSSNELEDASRALPSLPPIPAIASMTLAPKTHAYQFDLKATPMSCLRIQNPLKEDNLMSLLDGNPVPKTLKWKLKGYKTLRNEQAGDFAFVPGGKTYDLDVLSRNDCGESANATKPTSADLKPLQQEKDSSKSMESANDSNSANTLSLTTKSIENKVETQSATKSEAVEVSGSESAKVEAKMVETEASGSLNDQTGAIVGETAVSSAQKLLTTPVTKEGVKYLPISKSELSSSQMKCQAQPSVQYSSRPPKRISKPMPPVLRQRTENLVDTRKLTSSMDLPKKKLPQNYYSAPRAETSTPEEATRAAVSGWSPVEEEYVASKTTGLKQQTVNRSVAESSMNTERKPMEYSKDEQVQDAQLNTAQLSSKMPEEHREKAPRGNAPGDCSQTTEGKEPNIQSYFAPRPWKHSDTGVTNQAPRLENKSTHESLNNVYESFGWGSRETSTLKISSPYQKQQNASPCAATQARLQQNHPSGASQSQQTGSFGFNGSSMSGNSGGGSRKPPPSYPPYPRRRASSNSSSPLGRLPSGGVQNLPRRSGAAKSSAWNISTASVNPSPRRCNDGDEAAEGRVVCTKPREGKCSRRRSCDQDTRPACQREARVKKSCKRYCCPALQMPTDCDYDNFQCPKQRKQSSCGERRREKPKKPMQTDPTCLPNDTDGRNSCRGTSCGREGRQICTDPSRRPDCERRKCDRDRQDRSCNQNRNSCRTRERSCQRQERQSCSQREEGREFCTKPRRRESCNRRRCDDRDCGNKSAKCTGRRHYTQLAFVKRTNSGGNVKRFSSLPVLGISFVGVRVQGTKSRQKLAGSTCQDRFYGKQSRPSSCKPPDSEKPSNKCKKGPAKCLDRKPSENTCKTRQTESKCSSTCGKSKKEDSCKATSKSEDYCAKRRQQLCKDRSSSHSEEESPKDRAERERREMQECKKGSSKDKNKGGKNAGATGLERVISPCKQRQMKKDKGGTGGCSSSKLACIGVPLNCLANTESSTFVRQENKPFNGFADRSYSTVRFSGSDEFDTESSSSNQWRNFWNFAGDDGLGLEGEIPLPIVIDNQEEAAEDNSYRQNWFLSWFNGANP